MFEPAAAMQWDWLRTAMVVGLLGSRERGVAVIAWLVAGLWVAAGAPPTSTL